MTDVHNDTEEPVDYVVEEGQGSTGLPQFEPLAAGRTSKLGVSNESFDIFFYKSGAQIAKDNELLVFEKGIPRGSSVRLFSSTPGSWEIALKRVRRA